MSHPWGYNCVLLGRVLGLCGEFRQLRGHGLWWPHLWSSRWCVRRFPRWLLLVVRCGVAWGAVLGLVGVGHAGSG